MTNAITATAYNKYSNYFKDVQLMKEEMGVMQHHDAVTGTEQQHVANDYARRLHIAFKQCDHVNQDVLNYFSSDLPNSHKFEFESCLLLNISECAIPERKESFIVTVFNVLPYSTNQYVRVPVSSENYKVMDYRDVPINSVSVDVSDYIRGLKFRKSSATKDIVFLAGELPPLGYKSFYVSKTQHENNIMVFPKQPEVITPNLQRDRRSSDESTGTVISNRVKFHYRNSDYGHYVFYNIFSFIT